MKHTRAIFLLFIVVALAILTPLSTSADGGVYLPNPIKCPDVMCVITDVIRIILGVLGVFGTFMFIYGGILFMTSAGNPDLVKKAKDTLRFSTLGIVIVLASWIIVRLVLSVAIRGTT